MNQVPQLRLQPHPPYLTLALCTLQQRAAYRMTLFFNLATGLIWVVVLYYLWRTVYASTTQMGDFDWQAMRTYIGVSYAVNSLLSYGAVGAMTWNVRTGRIATELLRPLDYLLTQLAQSVGIAVLEGCLGSTMALLLGIFLLHISPPASFSAACFFLISVALGYLIKFLVSFMAALLCFWTIEGQGIIWGQIAVINLFSGALIPLNLLPSWLQTIVLALPFQGILFTPVSIYIGRLQGAALAWALAAQIGWVIILWFLAQLLWRPATRALEFQGG
ncbi:MAG: ABC-2 family transporter protein [Caldilineaceae bacterium]